MVSFFKSSTARALRPALMGTPVFGRLGINPYTGKPNKKGTVKTVPFYIWLPREGSGCSLWLATISLSSR